MKNKIAYIFLLSVGLSLVSIFHSCKKEIKSDTEKITEKGSNTFETFFKNELKKGIKQEYYIDANQVSVTKRTIRSGAKVETSCLADFDIAITKYDVTFTGSNPDSYGCFSTWDHTATVYFTITQNGSYPPPTNVANIQSWVQLSDQNTSTGLVTWGLTYVGHPSTYEYEYKTNVIDFSNFSGYSLNYCTLNSLYMELIVPPAGCTGTPISEDITTSIDFTNSNTFDQCKTVNKVYIDASSSGGIYYGGWNSTCSMPCKLFPPDQFEFQYKTQGSSTWSSAITQTYSYGGPSFLSLSPGTYDFRYRNKMGSPKNCIGPYSNIETYAVN